MSEAINYGYAQGIWRPLSEAHVPLSDRGFLWGDACFETLRVENGRARFAEAHRHRIGQSAQWLGISEHKAREGFDAILQSLPHTTGSYRLRITVTRGLLEEDFEHTPKWSLRPAPSLTPQLYAILSKTQPLSERLTRHPAIIQKARRAASDYIPHAAKHCGYLPTILALQKAQSGHEIIWQGTRGHSLETSSGNLWLARGQTLITPPANGEILEGIARSKLLQLAQRMGIQVLIKPLTQRQISRGDALFFSHVMIGMALLELPGAPQLQESTPTYGMLAALYSAYLELVRGNNEEEDMRADGIEPST